MTFRVETTVAGEQDADVQDVHGVVLNCEENPIDVRRVAEEQMTHFKREHGALRS
jgi:hypothetical protein